MRPVLYWRSIEGVKAEHETKTGDRYSSGAMIWRYLDQVTTREKLPLHFNLSHNINWQLAEANSLQACLRGIGSPYPWNSEMGTASFGPVSSSTR